MTFDSYGMRCGFYPFSHARVIFLSYCSWTSNNRDLRMRWPLMGEGEVDISHEKEDMAEDYGFCLCKVSMVKGVKWKHQLEVLTVGLFTHKYGKAIKSPWDGDGSILLELQIKYSFWMAPNKNLRNVIMAQQWKV